ncbi:relaxase domain-containing protein [Streptomyces adelaidensis]|uniref:relaxase domain-containing protein n=1 Tax=Streptomyces adelaidensis TaxID=2796465 RepID=UPI002278928C|nr:relaxase domain-containing protein [Streptomyces adelaidensis]
MSPTVWLGFRDTHAPPGGLIAGMFIHRATRSSDPHLHTHVAVSNKVQDLEAHWLGGVEA